MKKYQQLAEQLREQIASGIWHTLASLRNQVALVSQNVHLFNDTVANNIAYARTEQY
ncbi:lipid A export ATP-binding/permease MsbA domain protein, partial [Escherichia coli 99.1775]